MRASALFHLGVVAFVCTALALIGGFVIGLNRYVVSPSINALPDVDMGQDGLAMLSLVLSVAVIVGMAALITWRAKRLVISLFAAIDQRINRRLCDVSASVEALKADVSTVKGDVADLQLHTGTHPIVAERIAALHGQIPQAQEEQ